jgi:hypothetical protein
VIVVTKLLFLKRPPPIAEGGKSITVPLRGDSSNMTETTFTLVRTTKDRGGDNDDYDVCDGDKVIGRIVRDPLAPMEAPWFWVIIAKDLSPPWLRDRGYAVSRDHALAQFRARWTLSDLVCHRVDDLPTPPMPAFIARCVRCNAQIWVALNSPSDVRRICSRCGKGDSRSPS